MLKLDEFVQLRDREQIASIRRMVPGGALMIVGAVLFAVFVEPLDDLLVARFGQSSGSPLLLMPMFASLLPGLVLLIAQVVLTRREPKLKCPHCGKWLHVITSDSWLLIATRKCGHCGEMVLKVPEEDTKALIDPIQFKRAVPSYQLKGLGMVACFVATLIITVTVEILAFTSLGIVDFYDKTPLNELPAHQQILFFLTIVASIVPAGFVMLVLGRLIERDARLQCPHCKKHLAQHSPIVIASRNCPHCGQRVLSEPDRSA